MLINRARFRWSSDFLKFAYDQEENRKPAPNLKIVLLQVMVSEFANYAVTPQQRLFVHRRFGQKSLYRLPPDAH